MNKSTMKIKLKTENEIEDADGNNWNWVVGQVHINTATRNQKPERAECVVHAVICQKGTLRFLGRNVLDVLEKQKGEWYGDNNVDEVEGGW